MQTEARAASISADEAGSSGEYRLCLLRRRVQTKPGRARMRKAEVTRKTRETEVRAAVNLDGEGPVAEFSTGIGFLDHMLDQLARHGLLDLEVEAKGDLHIDFHHTTEDAESPSARRWPRPWAAAPASGATAPRSSPWTRP